MSRSPHARSTSSGIFAFIKIICIVAFAAALAYAISEKSNGPTSRFSSSATSTAPLLGPSSSSTFILINEEAVTLMSTHSINQRLTPQQFREKFKDAQFPSEGVGAATGDHARFALPGTVPKTGGVLSPDGKLRASLDTPQSDQASAIRLERLSSQTSQKLVLRTGSNLPLKQAELFGWVDSATLAVSAQVTSSRWIYVVDTTGKTRPLIPLMQNMVSVMPRAGAVWYITATLGEGLESPPRGPSELHRVAIQGSTPDQNIVRADEQVILRFVASPDIQDVIAYTLDTGRSYIVRTGELPWSLGVRKPLMILPDKLLLVRNGFDLELVDPISQQSTRLGALPEGDVKIYVLP